MRNEESRAFLNDFLFMKRISCTVRRQLFALDGHDDEMGREDGAFPSSHLYFMVRVRYIT